MLKGWATVGYVQVQDLISHRWSRSGLPDGLFVHQKYQFTYVLDGIGMEHVGIFNCYVVYFTTIWYIYDMGI
jgi:hypothetical protein